MMYIRALLNEDMMYIQALLNEDMMYSRTYISQSLSFPVKRNCSGYCLVSTICTYHHWHICSTSDWASDYIRD